MLFVLSSAAGGTALYHSGQKKIEEKGEASRPKLEPIKKKEVKVATEILDEDTLKYQGEKYKYNKDMINFLLLGVDTSGEVHAEENKGEAGQADTIILAALNNKKKTITLIPINRDTMTEISIYNEYGEFLGKQVEQIALAYAYGDGEKKVPLLPKRRCRGSSMVCRFMVTSQ